MHLNYRSFSLTLVAPIILLTYIFFSSGELQAETPLFPIEYKCGLKRPTGILQYRGANHTELSGPIFTYTSPFTGRTQTERQHYALLRGSDCWLEYTSFSPPEGRFRATGIFKESLTSTQLLPASEDMGSYIDMSSERLLAFLLCINKSIEISMGNPSCLLEVIKGYDTTGFAGLWFDRKKQMALPGSRDDYTHSGYEV